jgi:hypothetical protein
MFSNRGNRGLFVFKKISYLFFFYNQLITFLYVYDFLFAEFFKYFSKSFIFFLFFDLFFISFFNFSFLTAPYIFDYNIFGLKSFKLFELFKEKLTIYDFSFDFFFFEGDEINGSLIVFPFYSPNLFFFFRFKEFFFFWVSIHH